MQLDQISANIRRRNAWEGIDLGFAMARHWFLPLWGLWWLTALPVALLAAGLLHDSPAAVGLVLWWFKPLYEPLLLYWLSRRLFGEQLSLREALGEWRRVLRPRLFANLTLRRLSTNRSFYMPVSHLEGLKGKELPKRMRVLGGTNSAGTWLTLVGAHLEFALEFSFVLLALFLVPTELLPDDLWDMVFGEEPLVMWLGNGFWLLAMSIFAPFYVAGGFGLYLTRRSELEAWDLELAFRRMAPRFRAGPGAGAALALLLALGALFPAPRAHAMDECAAPDAYPEATTREPAAAQEGELRTDLRGITPQQARQTIDEVMQEKDFGETRTTRYWKYIGEKKPDKKETAKDFAWVAYLAEFFEYALWIAGAVLLGWVLLYLLRLTDWLPQTRARRAASVPTMLFGLPVTPESLPHDVRAAVQTLLAEGRLRVALSLLYRATLVQLMHAHHVKIPDSATEGECQRIVAGERPATESEFFSRLTHAWIWCAYGHVAPAAAEIAALAEDWGIVYGGAHDAA